MIEKAKEIIREALEGAECPAVLCSFGKDSMLLLHLVREVLGYFPVVIWFHTGLSSKKFARRMIVELDLHVWSWQPADVYVLPKAEGLSLIREQAFGDERFPVLADIEDGTECIGDFPQARTPALYPHFDRLFIGYKDTDSHWTLGGTGFCPEDGWTLGKAQVYAPIRYMDDNEVWEAIKVLGVPTDEERYLQNGQDPDTISCCHACLKEGTEDVFCPKEGKMIERVSWQPRERLVDFRRRFNLKEVA